MNCPSCQAPLLAQQTACEQCGTALQQLAFHGEGMGLLMIHLKNMILIPLTLGIYYFWGKVDVTRYFYAQTEFAGERFHFHGTGIERFKGALRVILAFAVLCIALFALEQVTTDDDELYSNILIYGFWAARPNGAS